MSKTRIPGSAWRVGHHSSSQFFRKSSLGPCYKALAFWQGDPPPTYGSWFSACEQVRLQRTLALYGSDLPSSTRGLYSGQRTVEQLWKDFFSNPSQWWDNRPEKVNPSYPDFKHKKTRESLWLNGNFNPPWVEAELAAMAPGTLQVDLHTWNKRLARDVKAGHYARVMETFQQMQHEGMDQDKFTFIPVLKACGSLRALDEGKHIHRLIVQSGSESDVFVSTCLVDMYAKCGSIDDAREVFNKMPTRNVVSWNAMIRGHVKCGEGQRALELSRQMQLEGVEPVPVTFVGILNACASLEALEEGRHFHDRIIERGFESNVYVASSLVDMYAKCGSIDDAWRVFQKMPARDVVVWSAMIMGYVKCGHGQKGLELYRQMQEEGVEPNLVTLVGLVNACASIEALQEGRRVHEQINQRGWESNVFVASSLVDMYTKCGSIEDAWRVFQKMPVRDVVVWSAMILGYVKCGQSPKALELSRQMQADGLDPDPVTFVGMLNACANVVAYEEGRRIHEQIIERNWESQLVLGNSLVDMYSKCGSVVDAQRVFNNMATRDTVSWTAMLGGYAIHGHSKEALEHFSRMCQEGMEINGITFVSLLLACSHAGLVEEALHYFESMPSDHRICATMEHYACMVDLLGRAGRLHEADDLIKAMSCEPNSTVWKCLLAACRVHGNAEIGEFVAKQTLQLEPENAAGYVLLSNIYAADGNWNSSATVQQQRLKKVGRKLQDLHGLK